MIAKILDALIWLMFVSILVLSLIGLAKAEEYSDEQIINAIYLAEGGDRAEYPYGIRSISCGSRAECLKICRNTVRNNRQRFADYGHKSYPDFISFLGSRYCPVGAGNDPKGLNKNWIKNVTFFLERGEK